MSKQLDAVLALIDAIGAGRLPDLRPQLLQDMTRSAQTCEFYNRFFFSWVKQTQPSFVLETGTDRGRSAAHFALGCINTRVVSIDIDATCSGHLDALQLPNVEAVTGNSADEAISNRFQDPIDILFIDSLHEYVHVRRELDLYVPKVRRGGLVFLDDIRLGPGMERIWREIGHPKRDISPLHFSGFGVFEV